MSVKISYSANEKYNTSPRSWYLHYQLRLREEKVGSALPFGNAVDNALNVLIEKKFDPTIDKDPYEVFDYCWKHTTINNKKVNLMKSDLIRYSKADLDEDLIKDEESQKLLKTAKAEWVSLRKKGHMMIDAYTEQVLPHLSELISVQKYIKIENDDGDSIIGYMDLIARWKVNDEVDHCWDHLKKYDGKLIIFDNKTSSIKYKLDSVLTSRQLATYSEAPNLPEHDYEGYIVLPKKFRKKKLPKVPIEIIIDKVDHELVDSMFEEYGNTIQGIKLGQFPCTGCEKSIWGCPYKKYCESGGQDTTGLVYVPRGKDG